MHGFGSLSAKALSVGTIGHVRSCHSPHTWPLCVCACLLKHCSELPHHAQLDSPKQEEHVRCAGQVALSFFTSLGLAAAGQPAPCQCHALQEQ